MIGLIHIICLWVFLFPGKVDFLNILALTICMPTDKKFEITMESWNEPIVALPIHILMDLGIPILARPLINCRVCYF